MWRTEPNIKRRLALFYFDLYQRGVDIGFPRKEILIAEGLLEREKLPPLKKGASQKSKPAYSVKNTVELQADNHVEVIKDGESVYEGRDIETSEWMVTDDNRFNADFVNWIDSINSGFKNRINYRRFNLYCQQAQRWLEQDFSIQNAKTPYDRQQFAIDEFKRISDNSLYFLDKYVYFKSGVSDKKYKAEDAQKVASFLVDSMYCLMIGKGRQIWFSTTIGSIATKRINFRRRYFVKFIAENLKKVQEIFDDKIKYPFYHLPDWMKCTVHNDQEGLLRLLFKSKTDKGSVSGSDSKLLVEAPYETAINGGSPDMVLLDEIGQMDLLGAIIEEGQPTLYGYDGGQLKLIRQLVAWGTGANMLKGGSEFKTQYEALMDKWKRRDFSNCIVPLFFDFWARPGMTQKLYDSLRADAYSKVGASAEASRVRFHQHYPSSIEDMFLSSAQTIVPMDIINKNVQRIYDLKQKPVRGRFVPIYDLNRKMVDNSYIPYHIRGVEFKPAESIEVDSPVIIYKYPEEKWIHRYYQGTDPINSQGGYSFLGSAIWDVHLNKIDAEVFSKSKDYREDYLQTTLMNLFYGKPPHLIEQNAGGELINFVEMMGLRKTIVLQTQLPQHLQVNSSNNDGIRKVGGNASYIYNYLIEMLSAYGENIDSLIMWHQLKTFVKKDTKTGKDASFATQDFRYTRDDMIDGDTFAYIASRCYANKMPLKLDEEQQKVRRKRLKCDASTGYETIIVEEYV